MSTAARVLTAARLTAVRAAPFINTFETFTGLTRSTRAARECRSR